jgi:hypothetical protein
VPVVEELVEQLQQADILLIRKLQARLRRACHTNLNRGDDK